MLTKMMQWARGEEPPQDSQPVCRRHNVPMELFKKVGKPARFSEQETESYTLLYRCTVPECDESADRRRIRTQIPVPGERTQRPPWASRDSKGI